MARRKFNKSKIVGNENGFKMDDFFSDQLQQKDKEDRDKIVVGLPLQAISLRYLFSNDVFPYSRMTELVGRSESCKTAFLFELYRWHIFNSTEISTYDPCAMHGGYIHNLVEPRDSPDLRDSIIRLGRPSPYPTVSALCVEDWQKSCSDWIKRAETRFPVEAGEIGAMPYPVALGVDSLTAATTRDEMEKTWDQGYADPGYSQIAKSINMWCKVFFCKLSPWPVSFIGINHQKESKMPNGAIDRRVPGGDSLKYIATFMFRLQRKSDIDLLNGSGRVIEITTEKNSLSPANHEKLQVRMTWNFDEHSRQVTTWDWHDASIDLITSFDGVRKQRIMDIIPLVNVDKSRRTADCNELGLKKAPWREIGAAIMTRPDIVDGLDKFFNIRKRRKFEMGVPYCDQVSSAFDDLMEPGDDVEQGA